MPVRAARAASLLVLLVFVGCGGASSTSAPQRAVDSCAGTGRLTEASDRRGDVTPNLRAPTPPPAPAGIDLLGVRLARSASELCVVFSLEAPPPREAAYRVGLRETGKDDAGTLIGVMAVLGHGAPYLQLVYPGADQRPDRGIVDADLRVSDTNVGFRVDTSTFPAATPPARDFEWEASSLGLGNRPNLQYSDCAPEPTRHVAYPGGRMVRIGLSRGTC